MPPSPCTIQQATLHIELSTPTKRRSADSVKDNGGKMGWERESIERQRCATADSVLTRATTSLLLVLSGKPRQTPSEGTGSLQCPKVPHFKLPFCCDFWWNATRKITEVRDNSFGMIFPVFSTFFTQISTEIPLFFTYARMTAPSCVASSTRIQLVIRHGFRTHCSQVLFTKRR